MIRCRGEYVQSRSICSRPFTPTKESEPIYKFWSCTPHPHVAKRSLVMLLDGPRRWSGLGLSGLQQCVHPQCEETQKSSI